MKVRITTLIQRLNKLLDEHGDIACISPGSEGYYKDASPIVDLIIDTDYPDSEDIKVGDKAVYL